MSFILPSSPSRVNQKGDCTPNFARCGCKSALEIKVRRENSHVELALGFPRLIHKAEKSRVPATMLLDTLNCSCLFA